MTLSGCGSDVRLLVSPGRLIAGYAARWDKPDGGKEIRPLVLRGGCWLLKDIPKPRLIYNLPELQERPDAPVLVVEGEKTSDATRKLFPSHVSNKSMGWAKSPRYQPGMAGALVPKVVRQEGAVSSTCIELSTTFPLYGGSDGT